MIKRWGLLAVGAVVLMIAAAAGGVMFSRNAGAAPFAAALSETPHAAPERTSAVVVGEPKFPLTYQGVLQDDDGNFLTASTATLTFALYDDFEANASLWRETQQVSLDQGLFTAVLGMEKRIEPDIFAYNTEAWLGVRVGNQPELRPRTRLTYSPYSFHALKALEVVAPPPDAASVALLRWHEANNANITIDLKAQPTALAFDGNFLWVGGRSSASNDSDLLYKINLDKERVEYDLEVGLDPSAIAFDGRKIWVANSGSNSITRFITDGRDKEVLPIKEFRGKLVFDDSVLRRPAALAFDGTYMWVANEGGNNVMRLRAVHKFSRVDSLNRIDELQDQLEEDEKLSSSDPDKLTSADRQSILDDIEFNRTLLQPVLNEIPVGHAPNALAFDGEVLWVLNGGVHNVTRIRTSDAVVLGRLSIGKGREDIVFDGTHMWVADKDRNSVSRVRADTLEEAGEFLVGRDPVALAFDGRSIWAVNRASNDVTKLRASDGKRIGTYPLGEMPVDITFSGLDMWVANMLDHNIMKK